MKRIALFVHCYPPAQGGLEHLSSVIVSILEKKFEVHVFTGQGYTLDSYKNFNQYVENRDDQTQVHRLPIQYLWQKIANKFLFRFVVRFGIFSPWYFGPLLQFEDEHKKIIRSSDFLIGIGMPTSSLMYALHFSISYDKKLIVLPAYHPISYYNHVSVFQSALKKASRVLYLSQYEKDNLRQAYQIDTHKLRPLIFSPFSKSELLASLQFVEKRLQRIKGKPITIGYVGQITARKNLKMIADISERLSQIGYSHKVLLAGLKTNTSQQVENYFKDRKNIRILYDFKESEKRKIYEEIDIFLNPSVEESFGIVTLEAMINACYVMTRFSLFDSPEIPFVFDSAEIACKQIVALGSQTWQDQLRLQAKIVSEWSKENFERQLLSALE